MGMARSVMEHWPKEDEVAVPRGETTSDPWVHRSEKMMCTTCMWYVMKQTSVPGVEEIGRCRRHAPTMKGFPVVYRTDWCGDHKLDENKA